AGKEVLRAGCVPGSGIGERFVAGVEVDPAVHDTAGKVIDTAGRGPADEEHRNTTGGPDRAAIVERRRPAAAEGGGEVGPRHDAADADIESLRASRRQSDAITRSAGNVSAAGEGDSRRSGRPGGDDAICGAGHRSTGDVD